ncbi:MAG: hypothetical protein WC716_16555 [Chitinophagaceae bacterium]|jgi:hypothetical protein
MSIIATDSGNAFEPTPLGMQQAVCAYVNDIGFQEGEYQGKKNIRHQIIISWELAEKMSDGRPFMVSGWYTLSLNEKATLRHILESWRSKEFTEEELKGFDLTKLIGKNCFLNLVKNSKGKAKIQAVTPMPKNMPAIAIQNPEMSQKMQEFIASMIAKAVNPEAKETETAEQNPAQSDDLPF